MELIKYIEAVLEAVDAPTVHFDLALWYEAGKLWVKTDQVGGSRIEFVITKAERQQIEKGE
jgi:hypothetical protein